MYVTSIIPLSSSRSRFPLWARVGPHDRLIPFPTCRWGESAGGESVSLQMVTNGGNTEGLFRGAFIQSGSPVPTGDITLGQATYDTVVSTVGCSGAADTLQCLREAPFSTLKSAFDSASANSTTIVGICVPLLAKWLADAMLLAPVDLGPSCRRQVPGGPPAEARPARERV